MRWPFRRSLGGRAQGRHSVGAAVTSIPSALPPVSVLPPVAMDVGPPRPLGQPPLLPVPPLVPVPAPVLPPMQAVELPMAELLVHQPVSGSTPEPEAPAGPRVQLGFRDGTSTSLDPASSQARALEELAQSLTRRA